MPLLSDLTLPYILAIMSLFGAWFLYPLIFMLLGRATINTRLGVVRRMWIRQITAQERSPFDAILLGHIINSVSFFGSATLIVLAGAFSVLINLESTHAALAGLPLFRDTSLQVFSLNFSILALVLSISFFSFIYALRKLVYAIALVGALPVTTGPKAVSEPVGMQLQIDDTTTVITEALKTFNFGIRGYYYAIAAILLLLSPWASLGVTLLATAILVYRQLHTSTARSIEQYVSHSQE